MGNPTIFIGPCKCGGYGQCFDEETQAELGICHLDLQCLVTISEEQQDVD